MCWGLRAGLEYRSGRVQDLTQVVQAADETLGPLHQTVCSVWSKHCTTNPSDHIEPLLVPSVVNVRRDQGLLIPL